MHSTVSESFAGLTGKATHLLAVGAVAEGLGLDITGRLDGNSTTCTASGRHSEYELSFADFKVIGCLLC